MKRIVGHWDVGRGDFNRSAAQHYHFFTDKTGKTHACDHTPEDNINCRDGNYAAHTRGANTGSIGICAGGMYGAKSETNLGPYPVTKAAWDGMCQHAASLCIKYGIKVTPQTVLTHAEVQGTLGIKQRGKWDYTVLPFEPHVRGARACGNRFRSDIQRFIDGGLAVSEKTTEAEAREIERTRYLQKLLVMAGYPLGDLDGKIGPKTRSAIKRFCSMRGIKYNPDNPFSAYVTSVLRMQEKTARSSVPQPLQALAGDIASEGRTSSIETAQGIAGAAASSLPVATFLRDGLPQSVFTAIVVVGFVVILGAVFWTWKERRRHKENGKRALYQIEDLQNEERFL